MLCRFPTWELENAQRKGQRRRCLYNGIIRPLENKLFFVLVVFVAPYLLLMHSCIRNISEISIEHRHLEPKEVWKQSILRMAASCALKIWVINKTVGSQILSAQDAAVRSMLCFIFLKTVGWKWTQRGFGCISRGAKVLKNLRHIS